MGRMAPAPNLGRTRQTRRLRVGVVAFVIALSFALGFSHMRAAVAVRASLFAPFFVAVWGIAQGLSGTDPFLAARGMRDMGEGLELIADPAELARVRAAGRRIVWISLGTAALLTGLIVLTAW